MSETRIHWDEDERELVVEAMAECYRGKPTARFEPVWAAGQAILAPDRRRKWYSSFSGPNSSTGKLFAEAKRRATARVEPVEVKEVPQPEPTFIPVPTPTPLTEVPLKELLAECIERLLVMYAPQQERPSPVPTVHELLKAPLSYGTPGTGKVDHIRPVRIGICGLLPNQFHRVKEQVNGKKVELVLVSNQYNPSHEDWKRAMDYAIVSRFVRHGHHEQAKQALGSERVKWVASGTESVVAMVSELVPGSLN